jgi:hypothetical protein
MSPQSVKVAFWILTAFAGMLETTQNSLKHLGRHPKRDCSPSHNSKLLLIAAVAPSYCVLVCSRDVTGCMHYCTVPAHACSATARRAARRTTRALYFTFRFRGPSNINVLTTQQAVLEFLESWTVVARMARWVTEVMEFAFLTHPRSLVQRRCSPTRKFHGDGELDRAKIDAIFFLIRMKSLIIRN